jgi:hypothetical protein
MSSQLIIRSFLTASALWRETLGQFAVKHVGRQVPRTLARNDQEIDTMRQRPAATPEKFPHLPFDPIPDH